MEPATKRRKLSGESTEAVVTVTATATAIATEQDKRQSLFVRSLPASVTKDTLIEHFSQSYPLKHATVVLDPQTKISRGFGFVTFTDAADAQAALAEFNNSLLGGRKIKVEPAEARHREVDENIQGKAHSKNTKADELRAKRQQQQHDNQPPKLIVRNLPWSIKTPDDLTKLFLSYGKVKHAVVPKLPGEKGQAGFGIVIIRGKKNAERALQAVNGKLVDGRTLAVDWAVDKETWQKVQHPSMEQVEATAGGRDIKVNDEATVAADHADEPSEDDVDESGVALDDPEAGLDDATDILSNGSHEEDEDNEDVVEPDLSEDAISDLAASDAPTSKSQFNAENTTVFIRNIPYDTTDESLADHFTTHFGPIRYARVVFDPETERPRGTAFVCFRHESDAKECVRGCPKQDSTLESRNHKSQAPSILQNTNLDSSGKYTLDGRLLHITRALPKPEADRRATESAGIRLAKQQSDKRKLYLLSEGTVSAGTTLYNQLSKTELDMRAASAKQRQKLVKTNPNLGLSLTRLSVRNLPRWIDARALKALAREAIVGFASDVKSGHRAPISKEELAREGESGRHAEAQRKAAGKGVVKQAKIVYESDMTGGKVAEGKGGRSRGYGFIEYWGHRSALMGLRWLNGHLVKRPTGEDAKGKDVDSEERGKRLVVEFAIENAQVVQRREERERRDKQRRNRDNEGRDHDVVVNARTGDTQKKRKRDGDDDGGRSNSKGRGKKQKQKQHQKQREGQKEAKSQEQGYDQDAKNKIAMRNRIVAQKRQKRKGRNGRA